jgi:hypothetical protein
MISWNCNRFTFLTRYTFLRSDDVLLVTWTGSGCRRPPGAATVVFSEDIPKAAATGTASPASDVPLEPSTVWHGRRPHTEIGISKYLSRNSWTWTLNGLNKLLLITWDGIQQWKNCCQDGMGTWVIAVVDRSPIEWGLPSLSLPGSSSCSGCFQASSWLPTDRIQKSPGVWRCS